MENALPSADLLSDILRVNNFKGIRQEVIPSKQNETHIIVKNVHYGRPNNTHAPYVWY